MINTDNITLEEGLKLEIEDYIRMAKESFNAAKDYKKIDHQLYKYSLKHTGFLIRVAENRIKEYEEI